MRLTPAQTTIASDTHRFRIVCCGRRFGKTTEGIEEIKGKALAKPSSIAYFANTYQQARDIAWEMLKKELLPIVIAVNESRLEVTTKTLKGGESKISLRGWENVDTARGQRFDLLILDEVAAMRNFWLNWHEVLRPTLTDSRGEALFYSTPKGFNHFYDLYNLEQEDTDYKSFHFTSYDNPFLPVEELDKARKELTEDRFAQEYLADFRKTEGLVYKEFDRNRHVSIDQPVSVIETLGGVDFGHTNPCAVVTIKRDGDNHYWITDEWYERGKTEAQIAEYVAVCKFNKCYPDPESPSAIKELTNKGVNVREVIKGKDSIRSGIEKVRELFKSGRIHIHPGCKNLIYELETYSYPDKKDAHNEAENPIKENDHLLDAIRYVISMQSQEVQVRRPVKRTPWQAYSTSIGI